MKAAESFLILRVSLLTCALLCSGGVHLWASHQTPTPNPVGNPLAGVTVPTAHLGNCHVVTPLKWSHTSKVNALVRVPLRDRFGRASTKTVAVGMVTQLEPVAGLCQSSGSNDEPNCCNFEALRGATVRWRRSFRVLDAPGELHATGSVSDLFSPSHTIMNRPSTVVCDVVCKAIPFLSDAESPGEVMVLGQWIQESAYEKSYRLCECGVGGQNGSEGGFPWGGGTPGPGPAGGGSAPKPNPGGWPATTVEWGDPPYKTGMTRPLPFGGPGAGNFPAIYVGGPRFKECSASNDRKTGHGTWIIQSRVGYTVEPKQVYGGTDSLGRELPPRTIQYRALTHFCRTWYLSGNPGCESKGGVQEHSRHSACQPGCDHRGIVRATVYYRRHANFLPVLKTMRSQGVGSVQRVVDWEISYTDWALIDNEGTPVGSENCSCIGDGAAPGGN